MDDIARLVTEALSLDTADRAAFLAKACGDDLTLRAAVEARLAGQPDSAAPPADGDGRNETCDFTVTPVLPRLAEGPGSKIGPYKILQTIGEGGFGVVYMAEQEQPVQRRVAIKIIKLGMDTRQVIARFEAERQALALMDHPHIAKVLDAGATETGRPYFVMELVKGEPITAYCDRHNVSTKDRLMLFIDVCRAVQHAHQKGVIHRDLKPSNVMVTLHDGEPIPKVIDFGIAKATTQKLTEMTLYTEYRQFVGTPEYMSPEQAEMSGLDVDTRSDIYSLGVLLYELLTGTTPLDGKRLREAGYGEIQRIIREEDPPKPSTRLSTLGDALTEAARHQHTEATSLTKLIRGDLDWIVMRCLEKDRTRRYETANGLGADVRRYLDNEPVTATPPSAPYRLRKFVRRNRGPVATLAAVFVAMVLGTIGTTWGMLGAIREAERADANAVTARTNKERAEREAAAALDAEADALSQAERADREAEEALRQASIATAVTDFLNRDLMQAVRPEQLGREVLVRDVLDEASSRLEGRFDELPLVEAELRLTIGETYRQLGLYEQAEEHLPVAHELRLAALGPEHPDTLTTMNKLAVLHQNAARYPEAEAMYLKALDVRRRVLGEEHPDTLWSMNNLATLYVSLNRPDEAEPLYVETLEIRRRVLGDEHADTLASVYNLGWLYRTSGRLAEAEPLYAETLEIRRRVLGDEHPDTLWSMNSLAQLYRATGRYDEAEPLAIETRDVMRRVLGADHPDTLHAMHNLAVLYWSQGRYDDADPIFSQVLQARRRVLSAEHPDTLQSMNILGALYLRQGRYDESEPLFRETLEIRRRVRGDEHPETLQSMNNLAAFYLTAERLDEARPLLAEALEIQRRVLGEEHPNTLLTLGNLGALHHRAQRLDEAEAIYEDAIDIQRRAMGDEHPDTLMSMNNLADVYRDQERADDAEQLYTEVIRIRAAVLGEEHPHLAWSKHGLATLYVDTNRSMQAEALFVEALALRREALGDTHPDTIETMTALARLLLTAQPAALRDGERALVLIREARGAANPLEAEHLEVMALALHATGDSAGAAEVQREAIAKLPEGADRSAMDAALLEYEAALVEVPDEPETGS